MDAPAKPGSLFSLFAVRSGREERDLCDTGVEVALLFEAHRRPVVRYLQSFGVASAECEEVVQETFLSLFLHLREGKPRDNLAGWIFRVAHNLGRKSLVRGSAGRFITLDAEAADRHADSHPDAEERMLRDERFQRMRSVVLALGEQERQCLFLRAEGLRYREIAETLGVSVGTVSNLLARSLDRLKGATRSRG